MAWEVSDWSSPAVESTPPHSGVGVASLEAFTASGAGKSWLVSDWSEPVQESTLPAISGTASAALEDIFAEAEGLAPDVSGSISGVLDDVTGEALGERHIPGTTGAGVAGLAPITGSASGQFWVAVKGAGRPALAGFVSSAQGVIVNFYHGHGQPKLPAFVGRGGGGGALSPIPTLLDYRIWWRFRP